MFETDAWNAGAPAGQVSCPGAAAHGAIRRRGSHAAALDKALVPRFQSVRLLAREIARRASVPVRNLVRRVKATSPQAGLTNAKRRANVAKAFRVSRPERVSGLRILLVDDVMTTGATASACARELKRAGAARVALLTVARVDRRMNLDVERLSVMEPEKDHVGVWKAMHALDRLHRPVLVLNASYEPINICAARRALVLVLKGVAAAEEDSARDVHSAATQRAPAFRDSVAGVPAHPAPDAGAFAQEHSDARPLYLPVLPSHSAFGRADAGSCDSALARRRNHVGEPGGLLPSLQ